MSDTLHAKFAQKFMENTVKDDEVRHRQVAKGPPAWLKSSMAGPHNP